METEKNDTVADELTKKAAQMLLRGATLLGQPCPYCSGVRVMEKGQAMCMGCGRQPKDKEIPKDVPPQSRQINKILEKKMQTLTDELEHEQNHEKQQSILKTINALLETMEKTGTKQ